MVTASCAQRGRQHVDVGRSKGDGVDGDRRRAGQLTVGDGGRGSLLIGGAANGITGQVTAFDATIGAQAGANGSVTLAAFSKNTPTLQGDVGPQRQVLN